MNYITDSNFPAFKKAYIKAACDDAYSFNFEGQEVLVEYARYVMEYVTGAYKYRREVLGSSFYAIEDGTDDEGCDTCGNVAQYQTFGAKDTLYLACRDCLMLYRLPCDQTLAEVRAMPEPKEFT